MVKITVSSDDVDVFDVSKGYPQAMKVFLDAQSTWIGDKAASYFQLLLAVQCNKTARKPDFDNIFSFSEALVGSYEFKELNQNQQRVLEIYTRAVEECRLGEV
jgi:hypothetical protein